MIKKINRNINLDNRRFYEGGPANLEDPTRLYGNYFSLPSELSAYELSATLPYKPMPTQYGVGDINAREPSRLPSSSPFKGNANTFLSNSAMGISNAISDPLYELTSNGLDSKVGSGMKNIGSAIGDVVGTVRPELGALIKVGTSLQGGFINNAFGTKWKDGNMKQTTEGLRGLNVDGSSLGNIASQFNTTDWGSGIGRGNVGRAGWTPLAQNKLTNRLNSNVGARNNATNMAMNSFNTAIGNVNAAKNNDVMRNFKALGGNLFWGGGNSDWRNATNGAIQSPKPIQGPYASYEAMEQANRSKNTDADYQYFVNTLKSIRESNNAAWEEYRNNQANSARNAARNVSRVVAQSPGRKPLKSAGVEGKEWKPFNETLYRVHDFEVPPVFNIASIPDATSYNKPIDPYITYLENYDNNNPYGVPFETYVKMYRSPSELEEMEKAYLNNRIDRMSDEKAMEFQKAAKALEHAKWYNEKGKNIPLWGTLDGMYITGNAHRFRDYYAGSERDIMNAARGNAAGAMATDALFFAPGVGIGTSVGFNAARGARGVKALKQAARGGDYLKMLTSTGRNLYFGNSLYDTYHDDPEAAMKNLGLMFAFNRFGLTPPKGGLLGATAGGSTRSISNPLRGTIVGSLRRWKQNKGLDAVGRREMKAFTKQGEEYVDKMSHRKGMTNRKIDNTIEKLTEDMSPEEANKFTQNFQDYLNLVFRKKAAKTAKKQIPFDFRGAVLPKIEKDLPSIKSAEDINDFVNGVKNACREEAKKLVKKEGKAPEVVAKEVEAKADEIYKGLLQMGGTFNASVPMMNYIRSMLGAGMVAGGGILLPWSNRKHRALDPSLLASETPSIEEDAHKTYPGMLDAKDHKASYVLDLDRIAGKNQNIDSLIDLSLRTQKALYDRQTLLDSLYGNAAQLEFATRMAPLLSYDTAYDYSKHAIQPFNLTNEGLIDGIEYNDRFTKLFNSFINDSSISAERRKLALEQYNSRAFGGNLTSKGTTWDNGYTEINAGGTHEENANQGVPYNRDSQGTPNLVEEGEVVFDDYVFSNRLTLDKESVKEAGLPLSYVGKSFADVAKKVAAESKERPNDPISRRALQEDMSNLRDLQEAYKAKTQPQQEMSSEGPQMSPEEMQMMMQQGGNPEEMGMQEQGMPQEEMSPAMIEQAQAGYAFGGSLDNLFDGDDSSDADPKPQTFNPTTYKNKLDPTAMYPMATQIGALAYNTLKKPDYSTPERIERNATRFLNPQQVSFNPIGGYMSYLPTNYTSQVNGLNSSYANTVNTMTNMANQNRGMAMNYAGNAMDAYANNVGNIYNKGMAVDQERRAKIAEHNSKIDQYNTSGALTAASENAKIRLSAYDKYNEYINAALAAREAIDNGRYAAINSALNGISSNVVALNKERARLNDLDMYLSTMNLPFKPEYWSDAKWAAYQQSVQDADAKARADKEELRFNIGRDRVQSEYSLFLSSIRANNPRFNGESLEDYEKRIDKIKQEYITSRKTELDKYGISYR